MSKKSSGQRGFTLIEVLIALAVLTIGLTGLAAMQLSSMQFVHSSHYRSMASTIAMDFEERMWLELADNALDGCPDGTAGEGGVAADLATHWGRSAVGENWDWSTAPMLRIPNLTITPGTPVNGTSVVLIPLTMTWTEARFGDTETTTESFTYNVRIQCRPVAAT